MLRDFFATKLGMTQAWTKTGKRVAVTRCKASDIAVVQTQTVSTIDTSTKARKPMRSLIIEVGYGKKKFKNMSKPLQGKLTKAGLTAGVKTIRGIRLADPASETPTPGTIIAVDSILSVGDVVQVQGSTKGRGFAGAMKRHGFHGGPATHGQSDRARAVGSIGQRTTPGRVWKGKKMPGHYGTETKTVSGLVVIHLDPTTKEVWLNGPIPGSITGQVMIRKTGKTQTIDLDMNASGIKMTAPAETPVVADAPVAEETVAENKEQA